MTGTYDTTMSSSMKAIFFAGLRHGFRRDSRSGLRHTPRSRHRQIPAIALALLLSVIAPLGAGAQEQLVDRVVAIVGDSVVLLSDVIQAEVQMTTQGMTLPLEGSPERDSLRLEIINTRVSEQLLLQAAARDTLLSVDEAQVEEQLNNMMAQIQASFPNQAELDRALAQEGLSMQSLREMRRELISQQQLVFLYLQANVGQGAVEVTEDEMREVFDAQRAALPERPASVTFKRILMQVIPSDSSRARARTQAEELLERARAGEDFAELASTYSQEPGAITTGGDLGWFRRGRMDPVFEEAAFSLPEGGISDVVETVFGLHIILVERLRATERKARHILIRPVTDYADIGNTRDLAQQIAERAQSEDFQALIDQYGDRSIQEPDSFTVAVREVAQQFPPAYVAALGGREPGEIVGPIEYRVQEKDHFAVLKIVEVREAGEYVFEDWKESIRATLIDEKRREALVEILRATTYVEIKEF